MEFEVRRGEIYYADLSPTVGSEQSGIRPVLILQNDRGNKYSPTTVVAAITGKQKKKNLPTHIPLPGLKGLPIPSIILCEQIRTIDKCRIVRYIVTMDEIFMMKVNRAITVSMGLKNEESE
jgi:mRNA interferase MazF